jgi:hypothetical protein
MLKEDIFLKLIQFTTTIKKFAAQGEKTGWTYITIPFAIAEKLKPNNKKSFRIKGSLDAHKINGVALIPMGEGDFIMALNATLRKQIKKNKGASLEVKLEIDISPIKMDSELMECLNDYPESLDFFNSLTQGHRKYFSSWIQSAKTEATKTRRIAMAISAFERKMDYGQMIRESTNERKKLLGLN